MPNFVARQPIFDRHKAIYAYELLFRSGLDNYFDFSDGDLATSRVVADSFLLFGIQELTGKAKAFINFTQNLLTQGLAMSLPREYTVVEILEQVEPANAVLHACRRLKQTGYLLALDDFVYHPRFEPLLELADIIKVDFRLSGERERSELAEAFLPRAKTLLAEKVETEAEYQEARELGYSLFQGYFFARPTLVSSQDVPPSKLQQMRLLAEINTPEMDYGRLAEVIGGEASTAYKLLNYINSAAMGLRHEITSLKQAITLLGESEIRKWASLLTLASLATDRPAELTRAAAIRAKMAELVAMQCGLADRREDAFLLGLFSLLDTMMGRPLPELLERVPMSGEVRSALVAGEGPLSHLLALVLAQERGDWEELFQRAAHLELNVETLPEAFFKAVDFTELALAI